LPAEGKQRLVSRLQVRRKGENLMKKREKVILKPGESLVVESVEEPKPKPKAKSKAKVEAPKTEPKPKPQAKPKPKVEASKPKLKQERQMNGEKARKAFRWLGVAAASALLLALLVLMTIWLVGLWRGLPSLIVLQQPQPVVERGVQIAGALIQQSGIPEQSLRPASSQGETWPATAEEFLLWITQAQPDADGAWIPVELAEIHRPPGETNSWAVAREKDLQGHIVPFWVFNPTGCFQDGWMHNEADREQYGRSFPDTALGSGVPEDWSGLVEGITFRPCPNQ
jgi:hypothetical protein